MQTQLSVTSNIPLSSRFCKPNNIGCLEQEQSFFLPPAYRKEEGGMREGSDTTSKRSPVYTPRKSLEDSQSPSFTCNQSLLKLLSSTGTPSFLISAGYLIK
uniref:Uncharacterized protein n=1 Tax=Micrurus spixii TaxID=129469 RepID=A0A2D4MLX7_9SAUR